jgi:hypothetical protein
VIATTTVHSLNPSMAITLQCAFRFALARYQNNRRRDIIAD